MVFAMRNCLVKGLSKFLMWKVRVFVPVICTFVPLAAKRKDEVCVSGEYVVGSIEYEEPVSTRK